MTPHKCPVCDGTGLVSRPPHIPGDQVIYVTSDLRTYECPPCKGEGILWERGDE